jgi:oligoribonuclease
MTNKYIVWLDVETTGLDERDSTARFLEVAVIVTDNDYVEVDRFEAVVFHEKSDVNYLIKTINPYVVDMHTKTMLWDIVSDPEFAKPLKEVDTNLAEFLAKFQDGTEAPILAGNSITLDRNFLREFLPESFAQFHYRSMDMSSVDRFVRNMGVEYTAEGTGTHNALNDIRESIAQAVIIRDTLRKLI